MRKIEPIPERDALELWALRKTGVLTRAGHKNASDGDGADFAQVVMLKVDEFMVGRAPSDDPLLKWVYAHGQKAENFHWRGYGEPLMRALIRNGWGWAIGLDNPPVAALERFHLEFGVWWLEHGVCKCPTVPMAEERPMYSGEDSIGLTEAASQLRMTSRGLRKAIDQGRLPAYHFKGRWWVKPSDLRSFKKSA